MHQIGEQPGGSDGVAPPDQAGDSGGEGGTADTPGAAQPADPLVQQGGSPGGLRAADGSGGRPDLTPEENFPGQQKGNNCAPQSCQQIIRQATGKSYTEAQMEQMGQDSGAYDPKVGTTAGGEADILKQGGVDAHTQAQTPENIQKALDNGQGVITGHDAATLWEGDPNYEADPANPVNGGHAVHTTGLVRDADGNVTHYVINDTGTGTSGRMVPADQFHQSLDTGPAVVTDAPIRTPAAAREAAPTTEGSPTAPEGTTAPRAASSRGDPASESGESRGTREEDAPNAEDAPPVLAETTGTEPQGVENAGAGDPTVQTGDSPGGMEGEEGNTETAPDDTAPQTKTPEEISKANYDQAAQAKLDLPNKLDPKGIKTVSSAGGKDYLSGWEGKEPRDLPDSYGSVSPEDVKAHADKIGHTLAKGSAPDQIRNGGFDGKASASHAEKQALLGSDGESPGVSKDMCGDCQNFFRQDAIYNNRTNYNTDPNGQWKFEPDGTITRPDGETIAPNDIIDQKTYGTVTRQDGTVLPSIPLSGK